MYILSAIYCIYLFGKRPGNFSFLLPCYFLYQGSVDTEVDKKARGKT